jgi:hypothetical protein
MKKKLYTKSQINEIVGKIASAILGAKAKTLLKLASKDPGLHSAIMSMADAQIELNKYIDSHYNEDTVEDLGTRVINNKKRLEQLRAKIKKNRQRDQ